MEMMLQPNGWSCLPTAFSMVLLTTPKEVIKHIGHDGSEILWPDMEEPRNRRGFHLQELFDVCIYDYIAFPVYIQALICSSPDDREPFISPGCENRFRLYLARHRAVLLGQYEFGKDHAVAWCPREEKIFDPRGEKYALDKFDIEAAVILC